MRDHRDMGEGERRVPTLECDQKCPEVEVVPVPKTHEAFQMSPRWSPHYTSWFYGEIIMPMALE